MSGNGAHLRGTADVYRVELRYGYAIEYAQAPAGAWFYRVVEPAATGGYRRQAWRKCPTVPATIGRATGARARLPVDREA